MKQEIRETYDVPVIFLSAYGQDELVAKAFDPGAEDWVVKPFSLAEFSARMRLDWRPLSISRLQSRLSTREEF